MGSGSGKSRLVQSKVSAQDFYEQVLKESHPVPVQSFQLNEPKLPTKYLIQVKPIRSVPILIDHSSGLPVILDVRTGKTTSMNLAISQGSRILLNSAESLIIISSISVTQVSFLTLKQTKFASMIKNRVNFSVTAFESRILATGGEVDGIETESCEMFDGHSWVLVSSLNIGRSLHSSIEHNGCVYVFSGFRTNTVEKLRGKWHVLEFRFPCCINRIGLAPIPDGILVIGGEVIGSGYNKAAWEMNVNSEEFLVKRDTDFDVFFYSHGCYYNEKCYLMGAGIIVEYDLWYKTFNLYN